MLLREHLSRAGATLDESIGEGKDAIFQYFAGEIFNRAQPANQRVLMLTAFPPSFTQAEAITLAGEDDTPRLLDYLYRRHLFIDRRRGTPTTYHYHGLFREFLLEEAKRRLSADERRLASARAALLMEARGLASEALALFRDADNVEAMRRLIIANALDWARQGRAQTLSDWIEALPQAMREADPWLEYWYGRAWIFVRPPRGRPGARARLRGLSRRRRSARPGARPQHDRHRATTTSGRTSRRSIAGCPNSTACSARRTRRCSIARANCAPAPRTSSRSCSAGRRIPSSQSAPVAWTSSSTARAISTRG